MIRIVVLASIYTGFLFACVYAGFEAGAPKQTCIEIATSMKLAGLCK